MGEPNAPCDNSNVLCEEIEEEPKCTKETAETFKMDEDKTQTTTLETSEKDHAQNELIGDATDAGTNEKSMDTMEPQTTEKDLKTDDDLNGLVEKFVENLAEQAQVVVEAIKDSAEKLSEDQEEEILDDQEDPSIETK